MAPADRLNQGNFVQCAKTNGAPFSLADSARSNRPLIVCKFDGECILRTRLSVPGKIRVTNRARDLEITVPVEVREHFCMLPMVDTGSMPIQTRHAEIKG